MGQDSLGIALLIIIIIGLSLFCMPSIQQNIIKAPSAATTKLPVFGFSTQKIPIQLGTSPEDAARINNELAVAGAIIDIVPTTRNSFSNDNSDSGKRRRQRSIRYLLHHKSSATKWYQMSRDGSNTGGHWKTGGKVKVIIHGFTLPWSSAEASIAAMHIFKIGEAYWTLPGSSYNIIVVDWTSLSTEPLQNYYHAAASTAYAGEDVAEFLKKLKDLGLIASWEDVHLVGFSLGSHVSGVAGAVIQKLTGGQKIGRITGLDPAGPLFDENGKLPSNRTRVLDASDATFVDVIHCNMGHAVVTSGGRLGSTVQCGHADFYPDGGERQKSCDWWRDRFQACSHEKCPLYFAQSISNVFNFCKCNSWLEFNLWGWCPCSTNSIPMGDKCPTSASGKYYRYM